MSDRKAICSNCNEPIVSFSGVYCANRKPCPRCGSTARTFVLEALTGSFILSGGDASLILVSYPDKLLQTSSDLISRSEFSIAVVAAHMACEVAVERALTRAFAAKGIADLEGPVEDLLPGYN